MVDLTPKCYYATMYSVFLTLPCSLSRALSRSCIGTLLRRLIVKLFATLLAPKEMINLWALVRDITHQMRERFKSATDVLLILARHHNALLVYLGKNRDPDPREYQYQIPEGYSFKQYADLVWIMTETVLAGGGIVNRSYDITEKTDYAEYLFHSARSS
jgi:hypothetical protein